MLAISVLLISAVFLILLLIIASSIASRLFKRRVYHEVQELLEPVDVNGVLMDEYLESLPDCVQSWLRNSQVVNREKIHNARIRQTGKMKTTPEGKWMPFEATYYYNVDQPGFIWFARVKYAPGVVLLARDKYYDGKGSMLIKLMSLFPVVNVNGGEEIDQGTLLRYLGEMVWFPSAAVSAQVQWEEMDRYSARATMSYQGVSGSGVFRFNDAGEVIEFRADRHRSVGDHFELTPWSIPVSGYKAFNGIKVPSQGEVIWGLDSGDFSWFQFDVTDVEYNQL